MRPVHRSVRLEPTGPGGGAPLGLAYQPTGPAVYIGSAPVVTDDRTPPPTRRTVSVPLSAVADSDTRPCSAAPRGQQALVP